MDSGEYSLLANDSLSMIIVIAYEMLPFVFSMALSNVREPEEETIELIMKRLGVQKSVIVLRDMVSAMTFAICWSIIIGLALWGVLFIGKVSIGVLIIFGILHAI